MKKDKQEHGSPNLKLHDTESAIDEDSGADDEASIKSDDTTIVRRPLASGLTTKPTEGHNKIEVSGSDAKEEHEENEEVTLGQDIFIDYEKIILILLSFLKSPNQKVASKIWVANRMRSIARYNLLLSNGYVIYWKWLHQAS